MCRVSIKDVNLPGISAHSSSSSSSDDPSSPRVSCMGHVDRNNKVTGFPTAYKLHTPTTTTTADTATTKANQHHRNMKNTKLKRFFSSKNFTTTNTTTISRSCTTSRRGMTICDTTRARLNYHNDNHVPVVNVVELDPPLPVIKRMPPLAAGGDEVNLWKRRSGGIELKGLKIKQIHVPNNDQFLPPTTV